MKPTTVTVTISYDTGDTRTIQVDDATMAISLHAVERPDDTGAWLVREPTGTGTLTIEGRLSFDRLRLDSAEQPA